MQSTRRENPVTNDQSVGILKAKRAGQKSIVANKSTAPTAKREGLKLDRTLTETAKRGSVKLQRNPKY
jgi:hypothetical protein